MKHFKHLPPPLLQKSRQSGMSVKFHPVVQIKLISRTINKKNSKEKKNMEQKHTEVLALSKRQWLWDLSLVYFVGLRVLETVTAQAGSLQWGAFVELAGETGVTVPFKKHVGKYCKHCVRSDCAKQPLFPLHVVEKKNTNVDPNNKVVGLPTRETRSTPPPLLPSHPDFFSL